MGFETRHRVPSWRTHTPPLRHYRTLQHPHPSRRRASVWVEWISRYVDNGVRTQEKLEQEDPEEHARCMHV